MNPYIEIILRTITVYVAIVLGIRLFGKKEISQLSITDLVFILLISNAVQNAMVGEGASLEGGLIAAATLFVANFVFKNLLFKSKKFSRLMQGEPMVLVYKGVVRHQNMASEKITMDELEATLREHGLTDTEKVELAVLEIDGNISVVAMNEHKLKSYKRKAG